MMREVLTDLWLKGGVDSERPWGAEEKVTFICPVPGYDRHFTLLDWFGIDMVTVPMNDDGPDAEAVAALVADDPSIKGIWIVPTYANPTGSVATQEVAERLASMPTAAPDFKIFWDNAYAFHHLTEDEAKSADILSARRGRRPPAPPDHVRLDLEDHLRRRRRRVPGRLGRDRAAGTPATSARARSAPTSSTSCGTLQFFGSPQGVRDHMAKHRELIAPKFAEVERVLSERLGGLGVATWTKPDRRLLRQPRRARRHRRPGGRAGQGGRHRADPGRLVVPRRRRPARPQHPARADLPRAWPR